MREKGSGNNENEINFTKDRAINYLRALEMTSNSGADDELDRKLYRGPELTAALKEYDQSGNESEIIKYLDGLIERLNAAGPISNVFLPLGPDVYADMAYAVRRAFGLKSI